MNILVVSSNYPSKTNPNYGAFVFNLMQELVKFHDIEIISPYKINGVLKKKHHTYGNEECVVYRPKYLSLSNKKFSFIDTGKISEINYINAVHRALKVLRKKPDLIYVHFVKNVIPILEFSERYNLPIVIASGESNYSSIESLSTLMRKRLINATSHIICVSNENKHQLIDLGFVKDRISVIPNAVDYDKFKPMDKVQSRKKLGLPLDKFIVGFIGHFINRKGPNRIIDAIKMLDDESIHLVCVGSRGQLKENDFTTVLPPVPNDELPYIYNSFDIFVLPTLFEGSCNVIEEAKASCLPIISSKGTSVEEQIDNGVTGILIDPLNISQIAESILKLKNNQIKCSDLSQNLYEIRGENSLRNRALKISNLLENVLK